MSLGSGFFSCCLQTVYAVRGRWAFVCVVLVKCSLIVCSFVDVVRLVSVLRLLLRGLFGRSFQHATVPLPVPSWTPADRRLRPRSGAIRPTPIISIRSSCGTPSRSIISYHAWPMARSRGHIELAGSRRDSLAVRRRINTVTKVERFLRFLHGDAILQEPGRRIGQRWEPTRCAAPGLEEE